MHAYTCTHMFVTIIFKEKEAINLKVERHNRIGERHLGGAGKEMQGESNLNSISDKNIKDIK